MAQINGATFTKMDTAADTIAGPVRVNAIVIASAATGGATVLEADGKNFYDATVGVNALHVIGFATPQKMSDITLDTVGTNVEVTVFFA